MLRRIARALVTTGTVALTATLTVTAVPTATADSPDRAVPPAKTDSLTIIINDTGTAMDGSHTLECQPAGGNHPRPGAACDALGRTNRAAANPFTPVPESRVCTLVHGGPASARITGNWHGRAIDAHFNRANGCEIDRWDSVVPALPKL